MGYGAKAPAELLDFLSSVCVTEGRGHEKIQTWATHLVHSYRPPPLLTTMTLLTTAVTPLLRTRWITQLVCGIVSEGIDPHASSLIYQLRIISRDESAPSPSDQGWAAHPLHDARNSPRNLPPSRLPPDRQGHPPLPTTQSSGASSLSSDGSSSSQRLGGGSASQRQGGGRGGMVARLVPERVQISTTTLGKVRPPYRAEAGEGDTSCTYEAEPPDVLTGDDAEAQQEAGSWVDLLQWLPHEVRGAGGEWRAVAGCGPPDEVAYLRAQLHLCSELCFARNQLSSASVVELIPLEALLLLLAPPPLQGWEQGQWQGGEACRLLPRDQRLCCELLVNVYLDSCKLDAPSASLAPLLLTTHHSPLTTHHSPLTTQESLVSPLYLWEDLPPPTTAEERLTYLNNSICGPATQLSHLEAEESSAWAREDDVGIPVWVRTTTPATGIHQAASSSQVTEIAVHSSPQRVVSSNAWVHTPGAAGADGTEYPPPASYEPAVLRLDERHVASQQRRLLAFVSAALGDEDSKQHRPRTPD